MCCDSCWGGSLNFLGAGSGSLLPLPGGGAGEALGGWKWEMWRERGGCWPGGGERIAPALLPAQNLQLESLVVAQGLRKSILALSPPYCSNSPRAQGGVLPGVESWIPGCRVELQWTPDPQGS